MHHQPTVPVTCSFIASHAALHSSGEVSVAHSSIRSTHSGSQSGSSGVHRVSQSAGGKVSGDGQSSTVFGSPEHSANESQSVVADAQRQG